MNEKWTHANCTSKFFGLGGNVKYRCEAAWDPDLEKIVSLHAEIYFTGAGKGD